MSETAMPACDIGIFSIEIFYPWHFSIFAMTVVVSLPVRLVNRSMAALPIGIVKMSPPDIIYIEITKLKYYFFAQLQENLKFKTKLRVLVSNEYGIQLLYIKQLEKHRSLIFTLLNFTK